MPKGDNFGSGSKSPGGWGGGGGSSSGGSKGGGGSGNGGGGSGGRSNSGGGNSNVNRGNMTAQQGNRNNDPAGPRRDSSGRNVHSASNPNPGGAGTRNRGSGESNNLGVTTGTTIHGNTAFGTPGGMATGYATRTGNISGQGPSMSQFSNFKTLGGQSMFPGMGNQSVMAANAGQAFGAMNALANARPQPMGVTRPGFANPPPMTQPGFASPPPMMQPGFASPPPPGLSNQYNNVLSPGYYPANYMSNPSQRPVRREPSNNLTPNTTTVYKNGPDYFGGTTTVYPGINHSGSVGGGRGGGGGRGW